jgi:carboxyl-terminal processing protease
MQPRNLTIICVTMFVSLLCHSLSQRTHRALVVADAMEMIDRFYVDPIDDRELVLSALNGMTAPLDQYSEFIPPVNYDAFRDTIYQEFAGIGIYVDQPKPDGPVRVITPIVGSPALAAGVLPGDEIVVVDGENVESMGIREVSDRLRGPVGTKVKMTLRRGVKPSDESDAKTEEIETTIVRESIQMESVIGDHRDANNQWVYRLDENPRVAYVRMTSFGDKTVSELAGVLAQLDNDFDAFVLDLRGNGGGLLTAAVEVADMFLDSGKIVATKTRGGVLEEQAVATSTTLMNTNIPMAVLIDHDSASASEIVAAALQDNKRAIVGGTRSFGKGTVQNVLPLEYGRSALRLTVAKYYRPTDVNIHRGKDDDEDDVWGVTPDEGLSVELDLPTLQRLLLLKQEASYPLLKNIDRTAFSRPVETEAETQVADAESEQPSTEVPTPPETLIAEIPEDTTIWQLDKPLVLVVERMLSRLASDKSPSSEETEDVKESEPSKKAA